MTRTTRDNARPRTTWAERAVVLGGFAIAALCTALAAPLETGIETIAAAWLAAAAWAFVSSLALALRRGLRHRDWRAFGRRGITDGTEPIDWDYGNGVIMGSWNGQYFDTSGYWTHFYSP